MVLTPTKGKWVHPHENLLDSEVAYFVKLVGVIAVGESRGSDVVKAALQKMKFSRHIKRSEGTKPPKVQLSISVKGVRLTDVKASQVLYDIKLNHVSFCTDDKEDKRMFSFIARRDDAQHYCYGLESSQANDITLTIGQAFELAYDKFLKSEKGMATSKQVVDLNKRIQELESENAKLKNHIVSLEGGKPVPTSSATSASHSEFDAEPSTATSQPQTGDFAQASFLSLPGASISRSSSCQEQHSAASSHSMGSNNASSASPSVKDNLESVMTIFQESSVSHSPSNKLYLQSKLGGRDTKRKQAYIDQTLASVERAKASLKNLKDFVQQRKLKKKNMQARSALAHQSQQSASLDDDRNYAKIADIEETAQRFYSQGNVSGLSETPLTAAESKSIYDSGYNSLPAALVKRPGPPLSGAGARRSSATSLYASFNDVMSTLQLMMNDEPVESRQPTAEESREVVKQPVPALTAQAKEEAATRSDLPETEIGDVPSGDHNYINVSHADVQAKYEHLITGEMLDDLAKEFDETPPALPPRDAPVIPPKPKRFLIETTESVTDDSACSVCSSEASSMDANAIHSYNFDPPKESIYVNRTSLAAQSHQAREKKSPSGDRPKRRSDGSPALSSANPRQSKVTYSELPYQPNAVQESKAPCTSRSSQDGSDCSSASSSRPSSRRRGLVRQKATISDDPIPSIDATLQRFAGEEGYLQLKGIRKVAAQALAESAENTDTTYDNVHALMESIRSDAKNAHWLKKAQAALDLHQQAVSKQSHAADRCLNARALVDALRKEETRHVTEKAQPAGTKERHGKHESHTTGSSKLSVNRTPRISPSDSKTVKARTDAKDAFDMQPFCGSAKISPPAVVRLPSPDQVHPSKVSRRRTTSIQQDLGRQLLEDPLNEISKFDLCKDGFSKALNMNESDISLDAFDPLKN